MGNWEGGERLQDNLTGSKDAPKDEKDDYDISVSYTP